MVQLDERFTCDQRHPTLAGISCTKPLFHEGDHAKFAANGFPVTEWKQEPIVPVTKEFMKEFYE